MLKVKIIKIAAEIYITLHVTFCIHILFFYKFGKYFQSPEIVVRKAVWSRNCMVKTYQIEPIDLWCHPDF